MCVCSNDEEGTIELVVLDKKSSTTNNYKITLGDNVDGGAFQFYYRIENLKLLPGDYSVSLCKSVVSRFVHKEHDLVYYVALEMDSKYESTS